jgi:hypothetical protein
VDGLGADAGPGQLPNERSCSIPVSRGV